MIYICSEKLCQQFNKFKIMSLAKSSAVLQSVSGVALILFACSCVNEEYDLNNGIDGTVDIQGSISLPIGNTEFIPIGDFLELDQEDQESILVADPQTGDYKLYIESEEPIAPDEPIEVPQITIDGDNLLPDGGVIYEGIELGSLVTDLTAHLPDDYDIPEDVRTKLNKLVSEMPPQRIADTPISINEDISDVTDIVKAIKDIELDAPIELSISIVRKDYLDKGKVSLKGVDGAPFTITFPDFITLAYDDDKLTIEDGHILSFESLEVDADNPQNSTFSFNLESIDMSSFEEGQGMVGNELIVNDEISMSEFKIDLDLADFAETVGEIPDAIDIDISLNVSDVFVKSVSAVLDPSVNVEPQKIEIGDLPEFITGEDVVLDLYNPVIRLDVKASDNTDFPDNFPAFNLSASLDAFREDGTSTMDSPIELGGVSAPIEIKEGTNHVIVSRRGVEHEDVAQLDEYYDYIEIEELGDLVKTIPSYIEISNVSASVPHEGSDGNWSDGDYTTIAFPESSYGEPSSLVYDIEVDYSIEVPLAFGNDLSLSYSTDFNGWNENFNSTSDTDYTLDIKEALIKFEFINSIPLALDLSADAIDVDGEIIDDIKVTLEGSLDAGNIGAETSSDVTVKILATPEALERFDGLRLNMEATSGGTVGVPLNENQGVKLEKITASIQGGIQMDLNF